MIIHMRLLYLLQIILILKLILCEVSENEKLILESEKRFSLDAITNKPEEFTIFIKKEKFNIGNTVIFVNQENNKDFITSKKPEIESPTIIIKKGEDGLHSKYSSTYIVLRKNDATPNMYTAHLAHIRSFNGTADVEWDNYKPIVRRDNLNFVAAFTPHDFKLDSIIRTADRQNLGRNGASVIPDRPRVQTAPQKTEEIASLSDLVNSLDNGTSTTEERKPSSIFQAMEKNLLTEVNKMQNETTSRKHSHNDSESREEGSDNFILKLKCPEDSGAIIMGRKCVCPVGTTNVKNKCVKNFREKNNSSGESVEAFVEKASSGLLDNFIPLNVNLHCPPNSGAILYKRKCICPEGTKVKDNVCTPIIAKEKNEEDPNDRIVRNAAAGKYVPNAKGRSAVTLAKGKSAAVVGKTAQGKSVPATIGRSTAEIPNNVTSNTSIANNKTDTEIFSGILTCQYHLPNETQLDESSNRNITVEVVDFYLITLRAQCYEEIFNNSAKLFDNGIVSLGINFRINLNPEHEYMKTKTILTVLEWNDLISGILLSIYSHAYQDQHHLLKDTGKASSSLSPDGKEISLKIQTLTLLVKKGVEFLEKELKHHTIKIINTLTSALNERLLEVLKNKQHWVHNCIDCDREHNILHQDENQIRVLLEYLKHLTLPTIKHNTFEQFYESHSQNKTASQGSKTTAKPKVINLSRNIPKQG